MVLFAAQVSAAFGAVLLALAFTGDPIGRDLAFGAAAGFSNAFGLGLLYHGLATGRMGIVAPIAAMVGGLIPVVWGLLSGEQPGPIVIVGVCVAVIAGGLISRETGETSGAPVSRSIVIALFAGVGLGVSLMFYAQTSADSGLWPVLAARVVASLVAAVAIVVVARLRTDPAAPDPTPARDRRRHRGRSRQRVPTAFATI